MKKQVFGRRFKRSQSQRKALFKNLISSLILEGRINTTEEKAKAIKGDIDKLVTKVKKGKGDARRLVSPSIFPNALDKFVFEIAPSYANRQGGYTRIIRAGTRLSDNASMAIMEWVEGEKITIQKPIKKVKVKKITRKIPAKTKVAKKVTKKETKNVKKSK
jgi:large subunit ribosomal protein L17